MVTDERRATLRVIANAALEIGLDRLAGGLPVHIKCPRDVLVDQNLLLPLQPESVVIEVLEDVPADEEFAVVVTRRGADGHHQLVAIVEDEALVERAIRRAA